ncbi:HAD domain-containing protein [Streptomyces tropicalis]|uniref:HAD domain-containing protein n=1 Tax=Streptomyces tropicalis TaxID=3034234 RepID=A0ABT6A7C7_9ACTN|nr:HAD domain-containing protein [Streptomyces tropicalis]MDF3300352.1 HAD domain-containing protein [Streptomyces tropicalis]
MTLLFLDVDGTLIPYGSTRPYPVHGPPSPGDAGHPLLSRIDPTLGPRLAALGCETVWATTWLEDANTCVAPRLGLPPLPLVDWPDPAQSGPDEVRGLHWKTRPLVAHAAGRPFVWLDDEITAVDRIWVAAHHTARALLHRVDHRRGLTDTDLAAVRAWLTIG